MVSVVIEPYEPLIAKAVELIEQREPGYFQGINKIVVEPSDKGHFGRVENQSPGVIFISVGRLKNALGQEDEEAQILETALTLAHEMGHLKSNMQGGEAPAENEESRMQQILTSSMRRKMRAYRYAHKLKTDTNIVKIAEGEYTSPYEIAQAILSIIGYFSQKAPSDRRRQYLEKIQRKLQEIDAIELSTKNKNPSAGIGASVSLIKNLLTGHQYEIIQQALIIVYQGLSTL